MKLLSRRNVIPFPKIDLNRVVNPIPTILAAAEFDAADRYFVASAASRRSLMSARSHIVLFTLVRNLRPANVVEIGTYHGGTTEILASAVVANGGGTVHTVGPFDAEAFNPIFKSWPDKLRRAVRFYPTDSMAFYMEMERQRIRPDLVFVDGDHSYEFALFDILCAARRLQPGGFLVVDDSIQAGPYFAVRDFIAQHPDWIECTGLNTAPRDPTLAYDSSRTPIEGTSLMVLRAPSGYRLTDSRPRTFGEAVWSQPDVQGLKLNLDGRQGTGRIHVQCVLGGFGGGLSPEQVTATGSIQIEPGQRAIEMRLSPPATVGTARDSYTLETWVIWEGRGQLCLDAVPAAF